MKDMAKIRLFYFSAMALILPRLKDITNFVLKLRGTFKSKAPLRVQFSPALGGEGVGKG